MDKRSRATTDTERAVVFFAALMIALTLLARGLMAELPLTLGLGTPARFVKTVPSADYVRILMTNVNRSLLSLGEAKLAIQAATSIGYDTQALGLMAVAVALIGVNVAMMHGLGPGQQLDGSARTDHGRGLIYRLYLYFCAAPKYAAKRCKDNDEPAIDYSPG
ncbi:MAG: hypothetical protein ACLP1Q_17960 [Solirubrobacteraceae bacterium]